MYNATLYLTRRITDIDQVRKKIKSQQQNRVTSYKARTHLVLLMRSQKLSSIDWNLPEPLFEFPPPGERVHSLGGEDGGGDGKVVAAEAPSPAVVKLSFKVSVMIGSTGNCFRGVVPPFRCCCAGRTSDCSVERGSSSSTFRMMPSPKGGRGVAWTALGVASMVVCFG